MKICGIIAEYNPFHNGHQYHLQKSIEQSEADYSVVVMSGNFVQRGTPAIMDKHARTEAALCCGADLVLELPVCYALGSAEYFAAGAVSLLDKLGAVTHLCFGSECGDIDLLKQIAQIYANEPACFQEILRQKLKTGLSFPVARAAALIEACPELCESLPILSSPNNILGIEYMKALFRRNSTITPLTITRNGAGYHDRELTLSFSSATAIRQAFENGIPSTRLKGQLPLEASEIYEQYFQISQPIFTNDLSDILHYKLLMEKHTGYTAYMDVSEELSDRIQNNLYRFTTFTDFCDLLKTKDLAYSRISRCLLHILLNIKKSDVSIYVNELDYTPYARILGFRREATPMLSEISKKTQIPMISKLADAGKSLEGSALEMLQKDILCSDVYSSLRCRKNEIGMKNEYSTPIVIV